MVTLCIPSCIIPAILLGLGALHQAHGFSYLFASEFDSYSVTHAPGYTGAGGVLNISVGINPANGDAEASEIAVQNVLNTFNNLTTTTGNLQVDPDMEGSSYDWESVILHELGHSLGLTHINAASESDLTGLDREYTKAGKGPNGSFDLDPGDDGIRGSGDDVRGDDVNLSYFHITDNDPFTIAGTVDSTTYDIDLTSLPGTDTFSANGDRDVADLLGYSNTEAVMQQGIFANEVQRTLTADDVAGIRYANAGLDEIAGTADDYRLNLTYAGITTTADIVISETALVGFAASYSGPGFVGLGGVRNGAHWRAVPSQPGGSGLPSGLFYAPLNNWFYNDDFHDDPGAPPSGSYIPEPGTAGFLLIGVILLRTLRGRPHRLRRF